MSRAISLKYPVVRGVPSEGGATWSFWCPFCKRSHFHPPRRGLYQPLCPPRIAKQHWPDGYYLTLAPLMRVRGHPNGHIRRRDIILPVAR